MTTIKDKNRKNAKNTTGVASRKKRERQAKKQDILKAAREVFAQKGLHAATLDEIAEKAEFAKGTLYGYFPSKEDLFISMLEEEMIRFRENIRDVLAQDMPSDQVIAVLVVTMLRLFDQNVDLMRLLSQEQTAITICKEKNAEPRFRQHFRKMINMIAEHIARGIESDQFHALDPNRAAMAIYSLCHGAAISSFMNDRKIYNTDDVTLITNLLLDGIKTRK
jgi:AcrR family transcriptional regulator